MKSHIEFYIRNASKSDIIYNIIWTWCFSITVCIFAFVYIPRKAYTVVYAYIGNNRYYATLACLMCQLLCLIATNISICISCHLQTPQGIFWFFSYVQRRTHRFFQRWWFEKNGLRNRNNFFWSKTSKL